MPEVDLLSSARDDSASIDPLGRASSQAAAGFDLHPPSNFILEVGQGQSAESARPKFVVSLDEEAWGTAENKPPRGQIRVPEPTVLAGAEDSDQSEPPQVPESSENSTSDFASQPDLDSWRDEVSARLSRYRARRRPRAPRYPSLRLKFEAPAVRISSAVSTSETNSESSLASSAPLTCQALAMSCAEPMETGQEPEARPLEDPREVAPGQAESAEAAPVFGKVLEFPRWAYGPPAPAHELADPVIDRPRILEVPEVVPPPPAMGGITIEDSVAPEPERQPGIDMPLRTAPLGLRIWAVVVDATLVLSAAALFGALFYRMTRTQPPFWELIVLSIGLPCIFWAAYQYLFLVYCGTTLGLRAAHLRMSRFDGTSVTRRRRRLRVLCSLLSGLSLGMGYAWQFLDEDRLCWHERVTRTYLAPPL